MTTIRKIVLIVSSENESKLDSFVEDCLQNGINFIAVTGENSEQIEEIIDELVVGDGSDESRYILTSSHPDETLDSVLKFARSLTGEYEGDIKVVNL